MAQLVSSSTCSLSSMLLPFDIGLKRNEPTQKQHCTLQLKEEQRRARRIQIVFAGAIKLIIKSLKFKIVYRNNAEKSNCGYFIDNYRQMCGSTKKRLVHICVDYLREKNVLFALCFVCAVCVHAKVSRVLFGR